MKAKFKALVLNGEPCESCDVSDSELETVTAMMPSAVSACINGRVNILKTPAQRSTKLFIDDELPRLLQTRPQVFCEEVAQALTDTISLARSRRQNQVLYFLISS
jgi:hypothetical protein